ncbi:hypothetical protein [Nocardioides sp. AE5]|uniref:hypothetical protein n=1 Tax=Nocardioides sp. AE5 TaxID=2962573 RepID=UPI0028812C61|nr:hypothetical protein [Nocardioides sp. AE5]MDT0201663.1 hypothetical protein [Nocardioides sp. AE5]
MTTTFDVLHALRVKGLARPEVLSGLSGVPGSELESVTAPLVEQGLVIARTGAMAGYMLTPAGKDEAARLLGEDAETAAARDALVAFDEAFLPHNTAFKQLCTRWQMRDDQPNDHSDTAYDDAVIAELAAFHGEFTPLLDKVGQDLARMGRYAPRLAAALARLQEGDQGSFARPMYDSYHDIWMELHNDVVLSLQRERSAADEG